MKRRNPNELDRDWQEIEQDIAAIRKRVTALQPTATGDLHTAIKTTVLLNLRMAELKTQLMRAKELRA